MAVFHYVLTLNGSAQALSTVTNATQRSIRSVTMQPGAANTGAVYIGSAGVTTADYGVKMPIPDTNVPPPPFMLADTQGQIGHFKLSDLYVIGTNNEKLHLLVVTIDG